ncbi:MAG: ubiquinol-cytochrome c reductase iron-sulfur subunit [Vicinamibacterales bacterium]
MIPDSATRALGPDSRSANPDGRPADEQPKWRRDFPVNTGDDEYVSRRELVKFLVLTSGAFAVGQLWLLLKSVTKPEASASRAVAVATVDELQVGEAKTFEYPAGSSPRLLVRTGGASFVAYDQQCTHLLCPVVPDVARQRLHCPCHEGAFDLFTGRPIQGPPRRPLPRVVLEVRDGTVFATGLELSAS